MPFGAALGPKPFAYHRDGVSGELIQAEIPADQQELPSISDDEVAALARLGRAIERAHGSP